MSDPSSAARARYHCRSVTSLWPHSKSLHVTRLIQKFSSLFTFLLTVLDVKEYDIVVMHCSPDLSYIPRAVICQEFKLTIKTIFFLCLPKCSSGSLHRAQKMCASFPIYSYLCWTKVIRRGCSFPEPKGTEERVISKRSCCYCRRMRNVLSVRPCMLGPSTLAGWKTRSENKGSPAKKNRHWFTKKMIRCYLLSPEHRLVCLS